MAKSEVAGSLFGGGGLRLWPVFSTAAFRRKLLEAFICGGGGGCASPVPASKRPDRRLGELLRAEQTERRLQQLCESKSAAKRLLEEGSTKEAAAEVRRLAKDNAEARETLAMLGAIPSLAAVIDSGDCQLQLEALYALLNLGIGNDGNKAAIAEAGVIDKMMKLVESGCSPELSEAVVANFLGLSALDSNKPLIGASGAITFLVATFRNADTGSQPRLDSLRALLNLSISPSNAHYVAESGLAPLLFTTIGDMEVSERALSVLSNLMASPEGRRAVCRSPEAIPILVDVLNWSDSPQCQEKAAYVLMIMAHKAYNTRTVMIEAGIFSPLLELTLIGSGLAQKRASRILEILSVDKGKQISEGFGGRNGPSSGCAPMSAPLCSDQRGVDNNEEELGLSEERKAVRELVQMSLQSNMRRIAKRANLPQDFASSDRFAAVAGT